MRAPGALFVVVRGVLLKSVVTALEVPPGGSPRAPSQAVQSGMGLRSWVNPAIAAALGLQRSKE